MTDFHERPTKRRKFDGADTSSHQPVTRAEHLHQLTEFQQVADSLVKSNITAFKDHLASISRLEGVAEQSKQLQILKQYCEWQRAPSDDLVHFHDLLSTWSFAIENNAEAIISVVPAALAQLLKTISSTLELRPFGLALIDSLLRRDQSKLFEKCLAAPKSKPHLASPCLRLLTEMVSFDAGARADQFWIRRDMVMPRLEAVLEQHNTSKDTEERRKPSVRRMALRLLLALLKYSDSRAKMDLLDQGRALHVCIHGLIMDGDDVVIDILNAVQGSLLNDEGISREAIGSFFRSQRLEALAVLYRYETIDEDNDVNTAVKEAVHKLLMSLCTTAKGILRPRHSWFGSKLVVTQQRTNQDDYIDLGLDSITDIERVDNVSVSNKELATFIQRLRWNESLQSSLILEVLRAAPELVADYFSRPQNQKLPPADSNDISWRAQFAFLFAVIETDVPTTLVGVASASPIPQIMVDNILPRPFDRAYTTKLLLSDDEVLKMSGARLATIVLQKLQRVLNLLMECSKAANTRGYIWQQAGNQLKTLVESRLPSVKDTSRALQHASADPSTTRRPLLECLNQYYKTLPYLAATASFNIGPLMIDLCSKLQAQQEDPNALLEQLVSCSQIAEVSTSTRWLHKADNETMSPLTNLLIVANSHSTQAEAQTLQQIVRRVLTHRGILSPSPSTFAALCTSLTQQQKFSPSQEVFLYLDNCISRTNQKPVKYLDELEHAAQLVSDRKPVSLLVGAIAEQWAFACKKYEASKSVIKNIAAWVARFFALLDAAGENYRVMVQLQNSMLNTSTDKQKQYLQDALDKARTKPLSIEANLQSEVLTSAGVDNLHKDNVVGIIPKQAHKQLVSVISIPESVQGLDRWGPDFDLELAIDTNRLHRLLLCMSSLDEEVRLQAYQVLQQLAHIVDTTSTHPRKHQIYLILGEVCESLNQQGTNLALPSIIPELASALLHITMDPVHSLYTKVNKFVLHKPSWPAKRVILYWIDKILQKEPDDSNAWHAEVKWLLQLFIQGLRTNNDSDLYRKTGLWEKVLSLYSSPVLSQSNKQLVLVLLESAFGVHNGVDMLWTRFGVYSWLVGMERVEVGNENESVLHSLRGRMEQEYTKDVIEAWKVACPLTRNDGQKT